MFQRSAPRICGAVVSIAVFYRASSSFVLLDQEKQDERERHLRKWKGHLGNTFDHKNRGEHLDPESNRHVVAVLGITGSGKSSTGNTMSYRAGKRDGFREVLTRAGQLGTRKKTRKESPITSDLDVAGVPTQTRLEETVDHAKLQLRVVDHKPQRNRRFETAENSLTSVTKSTVYRDYSFRGIPYRVIDTPGLFDTNRSHGDIAKELTDFKLYAKHGVCTFLVVLPTSRITEEHEQALMRMKEILGEGFEKHVVVVFTSALSEQPNPRLLTRDEILEQVHKLPRGHFLRNLVARCGNRVLGIENKKEPHKFTSQLILNQSVLDVVDINDGNRFDVSHALPPTKTKTSIFEETPTGIGQGQGQRRQQKRRCMKSLQQAIGDCVD